MRLPLPPAASAPAAPAAPRTTVAPFQAVPRPDPSPDEPASPAGRPREERAERRPAAPTGHPADADPVEPSSPRPSRGDRPAAASGPSDAAPGYRDWTSPSRTRDAAPPPATEAIPDRNPVREQAGSGAGRTPAPATEAIPDRNADRRDRADDERGPQADTDRHRGPDTGTDTGVVGGRAAFRAERQAAEAERRKAARRSGGGSTAARLDDADGEGRRGSGVRRAAAGLLAVAVVALLVLGVYSFAGSDPQETSTDRTASAAPSSTAAPAAPSSALPPLEVAPLPPADAAPADPVRAPVTVLNATGVTGLAADVAAALGAQGWESPGVGQYQGGDVAVTTVYFTKGDETQRQAAVQLVEQFPQITGPVERFFEVPDVAVPGLVVVTTGEWRP
ncbi:LytR C-terminal domain-containing protein [Geodermatophilus sp. SYSU D00705]